jgi:hypothetical protein
MLSGPLLGLVLLGGVDGELGQEFPVVGDDSDVSVFDQ